MISRDETILKEDSVSAGRMLEYGNLCDELHIVVLSKRKITRDITQNRVKKLSDNVFVYPTNSWLKIFSIFTAYRLGKKIIGNWKLEIGNCIVTSQDPFETGLVGLWLKKKFRIGLNIQIHGDFFGNPYWLNESFLNKIRLKIANRVIPNADSIRVVSERIKNSLKSYNFHSKAGPLRQESRVIGPWAENLKSKIVVAPIFTDIQKIQETEPKFDLHKRYPDSDLILLWVGKMSRVKNLLFLLRAFKYILEAFPKAVLVLVGDGPEEARLKDEAKKLGIIDFVKFEGAQTDLISYYKTADVFVFPSLYEGWGRVVIEAAAAGLPIVMSDVGCAGEVIQDGVSGRVVKVNDLEGFVRAITELGFNLDLREKYAHAALEKIKTLPNKEETFRLIKESWFI